MTTSRTKNTGAVARTGSCKSRVTKKVQLIRLLKSKTGANVEAVSKKLGWQRHTARAALSGLRKAGFEIAAEKPKNGKPTRYRIIVEPSGKTTEGAGALADAG